ncbi:MAG: BrnA antitoxin family protein [Gemmatimonadetes bacterium]|nr:BrnA antitoxin family protein [Gemmatimonadota bacterium]
MSAKRIVRRTLADKREGRTDWERVDAMPEYQIDANAASDPDAPAISDDVLRAAELVMPGAATKVPISLRVDPEVLDFFKELGPGYQSRMNAVLRAYVRTQSGALSIREQRAR